MTTHPIIDRLASLGSEELTVVDVMFVMGHRDRKGVDGLIKSGELEVLKGGTHAPRGKDELGRPIRHRYVISAAAMLTYLIKSTSGDKVVILEAIRQRFPHHLPLCERIAKGAPPTNIVSMPAPEPEARKTDRKPAAKQPEQGHPDQLQLFQFSVPA